MKSWQQFTFGILLGFLAFVVIYIAAMVPQGEPLELVQPPTASPLNIFITGSVANPGVYILPIDSRVVDAIAAAGGFLDDADESGLNLAAIVHDGEKLFVPSTSDGKYEDNGNLTDGFPSAERLININTATQEELEELPGIGPSRAEDIIAYRNEHGPFVLIEEIQNVTGIGQGLYENFKDFITID
ncbi:MAG: ComEA family DNA-binding protein [Anaerolineaceae bacterium]|nr:ComEA family DNA-binding protein [Anaerolineaceae bacterium]